MFSWSMSGAEWALIVVWFGFKRTTEPLAEWHRLWASPREEPWESRDSWLREPNLVRSVGGRRFMADGEGDGMGETAGAATPTAPHWDVGGSLIELIGKSAPPRTCVDSPRARKVILEGPFHFALGFSSDFESSERGWMERCMVWPEIVIEKVDGILKFHEILGRWKEKEIGNGTCKKDHATFLY